MPSLIDLRRRIRSVKNTQQITKAMKMISAAKLRRSQEAVSHARPYADLLREMLSSVLGGADPETVAHPLLARREPKRILLLVMAGEKGMAGAFNTNIFKAARPFLDEHAGAAVELEVLGKKARDFYVKRSWPIAGEWINVFSKVDVDVAHQVAAKVIERYANEEIDAVYVLYNKFVTAMSQKPTLQQILPFEAEESDGPAPDYIYEQPPEQIFAAALPRYVEVQVHQAMLESSASEHSARMAAMDAATRNAGEMIDNLTLHLNRVRQASITTEIIEVVSGAAALE